MCVVFVVFVVFVEPYACRKRCIIRPASYKNSLLYGDLGRKTE